MAKIIIHFPFSFNSRVNGGVLWTVLIQRLHIFMALILCEERDQIPSPRLNVNCKYALDLNLKHSPVLYFPILTMYYVPGSLYCILCYSLYFIHTLEEILLTTFLED